MPPAAKTQYQALIDSIARTAELHPQSYVVIDAVTHELLDSGKDPVKVLRRVNNKLKPNQIPAIYKKPSRDEVLILRHAAIPRPAMI